MIEFGDGFNIIKEMGGGNNMTSEKVNIFDFATSELSHDAILCYILGSYKKDKDDNEEAIVSRRMFTKMIHPNEELDYLKDNEIKIEKIQKQFPLKGKFKGFIDITVKVEIDSQKFIIIIEDKIHTFDHGNQLKKYKESIYNDEELSAYTKVFVFITLGLKSMKYFESINSDKDKSNNWVIIDRQMITKVVESYEKNDSSIISQYRRFLQSLNEKSSLFRKIPVNEWADEMSQSFFMTLDDSGISRGIVGYGWGKVNNQRGGFQGYWYNFSDYKTFSYENKIIKYRIYQQLEFSSYKKRIALKIELRLEDLKLFDTKIEKIGSEIAKHVIGICKVESKEDKKTTVKRIQHIFTKTQIREGKHMTIGDYVLDQKDNTYYRDLIKLMLVLNDSIKGYIEKL